MEDPAILSQYLQTRSSVDFGRLVEAHGGMVFGAALRHTNHRALAEEITQEVFIILVRKAATIREPHKLGAWLHRTTMQCAANANRKEAKRRQVMDQYAYELPKSSGTSTEDQAAWEEALPHLDDLIDQLKPTDREAVVLRFYEEASFKEIASLHGKSEDACKKRVYRALEKLASLLKKRGVLISPSVLSLGMGVCLTQDALPITSSALTKIALASQPTVETNVLVNFLLVMSSYKLTLVTATAAALIPIGLQWQANHAQAFSTVGAYAGDGNFQGNPGFPSHPDSSEMFAVRTRAEILTQLQLFAEIRNPYHGGLKMRAYMFSLRPEELPAALEALREFGEHSTGPGAYEAATALFQHWATHDPETAGLMALGGDEGRLNRSMLVGLVIGWIEQDPAALERFIEELPEGKTRDQLESSQWIHLTRLHPGAAADKAFAITDPDKQTQQLNRVLTYWWDDPVTAFQWMEKIEPSHRKDQWLNDLLDKHAQRQPADAFARTLESLEGEQRKSTLRRVIQPWAEEDASAAFAALIELPEDSRDGNVIEAFSESLTDLSAVDDYLQQLPEMSDRTAFISGLAGNLNNRRHDMATITPDNLATIQPLVESMPPGEDRFSARWNLATGWAAIDFDAARDWYHAQPHVKDSMKDKFVKFYQP